MAAVTVLQGQIDINGTLNTPYWYLHVYHKSIDEQVYHEGFLLTTKEMTAAAVQWVAWATAHLPTGHCRLYGFGLRWQLHKLMMACLEHGIEFPKHLLPRTDRYMQDNDGFHDIMQIYSMGAPLQWLESGIDMTYIKQWGATPLLAKWGLPEFKGEPLKDKFFRQAPFLLQLVKTYGH